MDRLSLYYGDNLKIVDGFMVKNPKLIDIKGLGYEKYNHYLTLLTLRPIDIADILYYDSHQWYEDITQWNLFLDFFMSNSPLKEALFWFTGIDFKKEIYLYEDQKLLKGENSNFTLNEVLFNLIVEFIRQLHHMPDVDELDLTHCGNRMAKEMILKQNYKKRKKNIQSKIDLFSIISSVDCKCCRGNELWDYPIYKIYEMYRRLEQIDNWDKTMMALYSGSIDTTKTKIDFEKINWSNILN